MRRRTTFVLAVFALVGAGLVPARGFAQDAAGPATPPCIGTFSATAVPGDPNAAVVRLRDVLPNATAGGTVTAYGAETAWNGNVNSFAVVQYAGRPEASFLVRAADRIEAVTYLPASVGCVFRAGVRPRTGYDAPDGPARPVVPVGNPQHVEPASCPRPYVDSAVIHAFEPETPPLALQQGITGMVVVDVTLNERGAPLSARIWSSPSAILNRAALDAAKNSAYSGAVFRCTPVPSTYMFTVAFP